MPSETRKATDTLLLSGSFSENTPITTSQWTGASAAITVTNRDTGAATISAAAVTLDTSVTPKTYRYSHAAIPVGVYDYFIRVTFSDGTVLTYPNDGEDPMTLNLIA